VTNKTEWLRYVHGQMKKMNLNILKFCYSSKFTGTIASSMYALLGRIEWLSIYLDFEFVQCIYIFHLISFFTPTMHTTKLFH